MSSPQTVERERLLRPLLDDAEGLAARALAAMQAELPVCSQASEQCLRDVTDRLREIYSGLFDAFIAGRDVDAETLLRDPFDAIRRTRVEFVLADYLSAHRIAQQVLWSAIVRRAEAVGVDHGIVLDLAAQLMNHMDAVTRRAGQVYVDLHDHDPDRDPATDRRRLLDGLLAGGAPPASMLARFGLGESTQALVVNAVPVAPVRERAALHEGAAMFARLGLGAPIALIAPRDHELVAVLALGPGRDAELCCGRLEDAQAQLREAGSVFSIGVSTVLGSVGELRRGYREATQALALIGPTGGVLSLSRLSVVDYLALSADETARRLIGPGLTAFLAQDRRRGSVLVATILAYCEADLSLKNAAARLRVHANTVQYRLARVRELVGLDPRRFEDLHALRIAIAIDGDDRAGLAPRP